MKKIFLIVFTVLITFAGYFTYKFYLSDTKNLNTIYLIPRDVIYFVESTKPIQSWKTVRDSEIWQHLLTNTYFSNLTANADSLDNILNENEKLFDLLGSKKLIISAHPISNRDYDFLIITDLEKTAKLLQYKTILKSVFSSSYNITERNFKGVEMMEFLDEKTNETLYLSVINNILIASYTHTLVEASIEQMNEPAIGRDLKFIEIKKNIKDKQLFQLYIQYNYLDDFATILTNSNQKWLQDLSKTLVYSGFDINLLNDNRIIAKGFTNTNENSISYLMAFENSGVGSQQIARVAPHRTSMYLSMGFKDFNAFYSNYLALQKKTPSSFETVSQNTKKLEDLLSIDVQENFVSWIDDEIALLKLEPMSEVENNDMALVLKAKEVAIANKNLDFILAQIKKKTPVKFKEINYKGYPIKFMSIKGFFKFFLGGFFEDLVTPYYTVIDEYVIFSNHPNTLKYIITNYIEGNTLQKAANYKAFKDNFENKSNLFVYINTPIIYPSIIEAVSKDSREDLKKNQKYFTSFSQIGLQLFAEDAIFKSTMVLQYKDQESIQYSDEFKPPTVGPFLDNNDSNTKTPIIVVKNTDPFDVIEINPNDLNTDKYLLKHANGKIKIEVPIKDGMKNGMYKAYYTNGKMYFKGRFKDDKRVGKWKKYNMEGDKILEFNYKD